MKNALWIGLAITMFCALPCSADTITLPDGHWILQDGKGADASAGIVSVATFGQDMSVLGLRYDKSTDAVRLVIHLTSMPGHEARRGVDCVLNLAAGLDFYFEGSYPHREITDEDGSLLLVPVDKSQLRGLCRRLMRDNEVTVNAMLIEPNTSKVSELFVSSFPLKGSMKAIRRWADEAGQQFLHEAAR